MRVRLQTGRTALFLAMLAVALMVFLPLRLVLGWAGLAEQGFTARSVGGTFWEGSIREARFGDVALGDLDAGIAPLPLLLGRARIGLKSRSGSGIDGAVTASRHSAGVDDTNASIAVGRALQPLPITAIDLTDVSVRFVDGACDRAEGRVRATLAGSGLPTPSAMAGPARCDGEALLLPLTGGPGEGANLRLWQDGRYRAELTLPTGQPADAARLQAAGFIQEAAGWRLAIEGRF